MRTKQDVLDQLVFNVGLEVEQAEDLYESARKYMGYKTEKGVELPKEADAVAFVLGFGGAKEEFVFTYGESPKHVFNGGWTVVEAQSMGIAEALFFQRHPKKGGKNYAACYPEDEWDKTFYPIGKQGNYGKFEMERIVQPNMAQ